MLGEPAVKNGANAFKMSRLKKAIALSFCARGDFALRKQGAKATRAAGDLLDLRGVQHAVLHAVKFRGRRENDPSNIPFFRHIFE